MSFYTRGFKFKMGRLVIAHDVRHALNPLEVVESLLRHVGGDWGDLDEHDWKANNDAIEFGGRIVSRYFTEDGRAHWIITECDRSVTTVLLPKEY